MVYFKSIRGLVRRENEENHRSRWLCRNQKKTCRIQVMALSPYQYVLWFGAQVTGNLTYSCILYACFFYLSSLLLADIYKTIQHPYVCRKGRDKEIDLLTGDVLLRSRVMSPRKEAVFPALLQCTGLIQKQYIIRIDSIYCILEIIRSEETSSRIFTCTSC